MPADFSPHIDLWTSYQPSLPQQDWITLPLEAAAAFAVSNYIPVRKEPLWPYNNESNRAVRNSSRHPGDFALPLMGAMSLPIFAQNIQDDSKFSAAGFARGWIHAHLLTEIATSTAKRTFGRHRPFYDTEKSLGKLREDDSLSFFSGHASHAFCAATYLSNMAFLSSQSRLWSWGSSSLLFAGATWVAWGRANDNQHHWDDVTIGAVVGAGLSSWVFHRVDTIQYGVESGTPGDEPRKKGEMVRSSLFLDGEYVGVQYSLNL